MDSNAAFAAAKFEKNRAAQTGMAIGNPSLSAIFVQNT
jgi:hypothetical protein